VFLKPQKCFEKRKEERKIIKPLRNKDYLNGRKNNFLSFLMMMFDA